MRHRRRTVSFMALGGGQTIGNSCYYLGLGASPVLLDCGASRRPWGLAAPDFDAWSDAVQARGSLDGGQADARAEIRQLFVSHAHLDHARLVTQFAHRHPETEVYMTELTRAFLAVQSAGEPLGRVNVVSYGQTLSFDGYEASFWPAGHIPGAMMTLFSYHGRRILYTGDYTSTGTPWTDACSLPDGPIDTLIVCAVHAFHPYRMMPGGLQGVFEAVCNTLLRGRSAYCRCSQLSKGIELLKYLRSSDRLRDVPIYLDERHMRMVHALEDLGIPVLTDRDYPLTLWRRGQRCIVLTSEAPGLAFSSFWQIAGDQFALHDDFRKTADFIRRVQPDLAVIVHCQPSEEASVASVLGRDGNCRTQFLFPEDGTMYEL